MKKRELKTLKIKGAFFAIVTISMIVSASLARAEPVCGEAGLIAAIDARARAERAAIARKSEMGVFARLKDSVSEALGLKKNAKQVSESSAQSASKTVTELYSDFDAVNQVVRNDLAQIKKSGVITPEEFARMQENAASLAGISKELTSRLTTSLEYLEKKRLNSKLSKSEAQRVNDEVRVLRDTIRAVQINAENPAKLVAKIERSAKGVKNAEANTAVAIDSSKPAALDSLVPSDAAPSSGRPALLPEKPVGISQAPRALSRPPAGSQQPVQARSFTPESVAPRPGVFGWVGSKVFDPIRSIFGGKVEISATPRERFSNMYEVRERRQVESGPGSSPDRFVPNEAERQWETKFIAEYERPRGYTLSDGRRVPVVSRSDREPFIQRFVSLESKNGNNRVSVSEFDVLKTMNEVVTENKALNTAIKSKRNSIAFELLMSGKYPHLKKAFDTYLENRNGLPFEASGIAIHDSYKGFSIGVDLDHPSIRGPPEKVAAIERELEQFANDQDVVYADWINNSPIKGYLNASGRAFIRDARRHFRGATGPTLEMAEYAAKNGARHFKDVEARVVADLEQIERDRVEIQKAYGTKSGVLTEIPGARGQYDLSPEALEIFRKARGKSTAEYADYIYERFLDRFNIDLRPDASKAESDPMHKIDLLARHYDRSAKFVAELYLPERENIPDSSIGFGSHSMDLAGLGAKQHFLTLAAIHKTQGKSLGEVFSATREAEVQTTKFKKDYAQIYDKSAKAAYGEEHETAIAGDDAGFAFNGPKTIENHLQFLHEFKVRSEKSDAAKIGLRIDPRAAVLSDAYLDTGEPIQKRERSILGDTAEKIEKSIRIEIEKRIPASDHAGRELVKDTLIKVVLDPNQKSQSVARVLLSNELPKGLMRDVKAAFDATLAKPQFSEVRSDGSDPLFYERKNIFQRALAMVKEWFAPKKTIHERETPVVAAPERLLAKSRVEAEKIPRVELQRDSQRLTVENEARPTSEMIMPDFSELTRVLKVDESGYGTLVYRDKHGIEWHPSNEGYVDRDPATGKWFVSTMGEKGTNQRVEVRIPIEVRQADGTIRVENQSAQEPVIARSVTEPLEIDHVGDTSDGYDERVALWRKAKAADGKAVTHGQNIRRKSGEALNSKIEGFSEKFDAKNEALEAHRAVAESYREKLIGEGIPGEALSVHCEAGHCTLRLHAEKLDWSANRPRHMLEKATRIFNSKNIEREANPRRPERMGLARQIDPETGKRVVDKSAGSYTVQDIEFSTASDSQYEASFDSDHRVVRMNMLTLELAGQEFVRRTGFAHELKHAMSSNQHHRNAIPHIQIYRLQPIADYNGTRPMEHVGLRNEMTALRDVTPGVTTAKQSEAAFFDLMANYNDMYFVDESALTYPHDLRVEHAENKDYVETLQKVIEEQKNHPGGHAENIWSGLTPAKRYEFGRIAAAIEADILNVVAKAEFQKALGNQTIELAEVAKEMVLKAEKSHKKSPLRRDAEHNLPYLRVAHPTRGFEVDMLFKEPQEIVGDLDRVIAETKKQIANSDKIIAESKETTQTLDGYYREMANDPAYKQWREKHEIRHWGDIDPDLRGLAESIDGRRMPKRLADAIRTSSKFQEDARGRNERADYGMKSVFEPEIHRRLSPSERRELAGRIHEAHSRPDLRCAVGECTQAQLAGKLRVLTKIDPAKKQTRAFSAKQARKLIETGVVGFPELVMKTPKEIVADRLIVSAENPAHRLKVSPERFAQSVVPVSRLDALAAAETALGMGEKLREVHGLMQNRGVYKSQIAIDLLSDGKTGWIKDFSQASEALASAFEDISATLLAKKARAKSPVEEVQLQLQSDNAREYAASVRVDQAHTESTVHPDESVLRKTLDQLDGASEGAIASARGGSADLLKKGLLEFDTRFSEALTRMESLEARGKLGPKTKKETAQALRRARVELNIRLAAAVAEAPVEKAPTVERGVAGQHDPVALKLSKEFHLNGDEAQRLIDYGKREGVGAEEVYKIYAEEMKKGCVP